MKGNMERRYMRMFMWLAFAIVFLVLDMEFPRMYSDVAGVLVAILMFTVGRGYDPDRILARIIYVVITVALDMPWSVTIIAMEIMYEIECADRYLKWEVEDEKGR